MEDQGGRSTPPYLRSVRGVPDSPFRGSMRSEANSSISSYRDFPHAKKYQAEGLASPRGIAPQANSRAVISALKGLQEKIRKLELERTEAEDNLKRLATESKHYKDILQKEHHAKSTSQGIISKQNDDLQNDLQGAEARCHLLEKQLDYMRKMVQTAEMDRDNAVQRSAMLTQQISQQATADIKGQIGKLTGLEREHMKLTASQSLAESKIRELEERLRNEAHHRKLLEDKTVQLQTESERNRILLRAASPPPKIKKKKKKKVKAKSKPQPVPGNPPGHFHLNMGNIPFVVGKSASKSHSVGANIQQALSLLKGHNPALCNALAQRQARRCSSSTSSDSEGLEDLLLGLQDEFGHMSFEHQELGRQINETDDLVIREDLERELEHLVKRMEAKGEQIAMVKHQINKRSEQRTRPKYRPQPHVHVRPRSASARLPASGGEIEVVTTVKTKGSKGVFAGVENRIPQKPGVNADKNLKVLKGMQNLQSSLTKDDLHWD
ncbi:centrosomal protein of 57 kDa-like [Actinia tenebrosa]|uniref:Centrosomal protein of 57 kDa-like n=1 Tax=Actinia tenebrosa TaxID=6105 RepID=A0A6P8I864_ACTTE|nr:centrosomal protein of 57 kDa-like [Actinia tenebrosa]